ncbi:MAG: protein-L-isoaspartate O-methyltransferase [Caulobacter sp.]|nr:protein-L-isoaspartate O-methyltransferase [Caulobacter sp.]
MAADFAAARDNMVESQIRTADVTDLAIQDAVRHVDRERLLPEGKSFSAYADTEVEYAPGRFLMRPRDVAKMLQALEPRAGETALAIAAPYAAAVLERLGLTVERLDDAALRVAHTGRYDLVISEGAVSEPPEDWKDSLALHGRLGIVVRIGPLGRAMLYIRSQDGVGARSLFESSAVVLSGFEPKASFVF